MDDLVGGTDEFYSITVVQADKTLDSQIVADQVVHVLEKRHQCAGETILILRFFKTKLFRTVCGHTIPERILRVTAKQAEDIPFAHPG